MALNPQQADTARLLYGLARGAGLDHQRALEVVAASYAESGLNPRAINKSSGAAGLFQLLSPGYRRKAQAGGGLLDPAANTRAILPDYVNFFKNNPGAAPGAAGAAVERSGQGAGFYAAPLAQLASIGGGGGATGTAPQGGGTLTSPVSDRRQLALNLIAQIGAKHNAAPMSGLQGLLDQARQREVTSGVQTTDGRSFNVQSTGHLAAFPVAGGAQFTNDWGAARADTGTHKGTDLFAATGTPVVAVEDGTISKMGPSAIGGNRIWLNGRYYYAHLSRFAQGIRPGAQVKAGQVIGYVGTTGDAKGTSPHLHFGFDPNGTQGQSWANPYPLLGAR